MVHSQATDPGEELFKLVMPLIANETQQILLSRFPVGGESTVAMLRAFQQNSQEMAASEAYQRSVLALWEEQLEIGSEIVFSGVAAEDPAAVVPGNHPLLWSGYMLIGDSE